MPNELWHVDTTVIRLLDGSKVYLRVPIVDPIASKRSPVDGCILSMPYPTLAGRLWSFSAPCRRAGRVSLYR